MTKPPTAIVGNTGRIGLPVRFDIMSTIDLRIPFGRLLCEPRVHTLVADLSHLAYIDSMGIGMLIAWSRSCQERGKAFALGNCDRKIVRLLKLVGVERMFVFVAAA